MNRLRLPAAKRRWSVACAAVVVTLLAGCEPPPVETVQRGYRGTGMVEVYSPTRLREQAAVNTPPAPSTVPPITDGPKAKDVYQNVKVLGDLPVPQFAATMVDITNWVAPTQGCTYCHTANFAEDTVYTKVVSRRMLEMTRHINADWKTHVGNAGVSCYTCHRGNNVPQQIWFPSAENRVPQPHAGNRGEQNIAGSVVALASLPNDPLSAYLEDSKEIRVIGGTALASGNRQSTKQAEWTYGLMMHMSDSLGVNCTYCHNTRSFAAWEASAPPRATAWYGIRMVRDLNNAYLTPLGSALPPHRLGPDGEAPRANCATCHQGAYKPLYGADIVGGHPALVPAAAR